MKKWIGIHEKVDWYIGCGVRTFSDRLALVSSADPLPSGIKRVALFPLAVVFAGLLFPDAALSCSCEPPGTPLEALALDDAVFTGRVVAIAEASDDEYEYESWIFFKLSAVWKGSFRADIVAIRTETGQDVAHCGYDFEVGGEYLVYARLWGDGHLHTGICSRTNHLAAATEDVALLGEPIFRPVATSVAPMSWGGVKRGHLLDSGIF